MNIRSKYLGSAAGAVLALGLGGSVWGHGWVGMRLFPATVSTEDPMVADELALPVFSLYSFPAGDEGPETRTMSAGFEFSKVIWPKVSLSVAEQRLWQNPREGRLGQGWDNMELGIKYEVWRDEAHEAIVSVGLDVDLGGTGSLSIGRESYTTYTPTVYFGKGFGDLPEGLKYLRPLAVTGAIGQTIPSRAVPNSLEWSFAIEYSLPYLRQHVEDVGMPEPFRNMIPLVEFSMETAENRGPLGVTRGTINPGVLWESKYFQVGIEALIPVNKASGNHVGGMLTIEIYIDDLLPQVFGKPLFGD